MKWAPVLRQFAVAVGILGGLWLGGLLLGLLLGPILPAPPGRVAMARHGNLFRVVSLYASFGTLACVLLAVQVARLVAAKPARLRIE